MVASIHRTIWPNCAQVTAGGFAGGLTNFVLGSAVGNADPFSTHFAVGAKLAIMVRPQNVAITKWERYDASELLTASTMSRPTPIGSSNGGALVSWQAGDLPLVIFCDSGADIVSLLREGYFSTSASVPAGHPRGGVRNFDDGAGTVERRIYTGSAEITYLKFDWAAARATFSGYEVLATNGVRVTAADADRRMQVLNTSSTAARFPGFDVFNWTGGFAGEGAFSGFAARGTQGAPAAVQAGDNLLVVGGYGWNGSGFVNGGKLLFRPTATFSGSVQDTEAVVRVFKGTTAVDAVKVTPAGQLALNGATPFGYLSVRATGATGTTSEAVSAGNNHASFAANLVALLAGRTANAAYSFVSCHSDHASLGGAGGDREFDFRGDGNAFADGSFTGGGADFAWLLEWEDGNPLREDRMGWSVVLAGDRKVRRAVAGEVPDGVVCARPTVLGGNPLAWPGKYERDAFGRTVTEPVEVVSWTERELAAPEVPPAAAVLETRVVEEMAEVDVEDAGDGKPGTVAVPVRLRRMVEVQAAAAGRPAEWREVERSFHADRLPQGVTPPADAKRETIRRPIVSASWEPSRGDYVTREQRAAAQGEWAKVGLMGFIAVRDSEVTAPGWKRQRALGPGVSEWLVR